MLLKGRVMKAAGGFFTVLTGDGFRYLCQARGSLKRGEAALYVGDIVDFKPENSSSSARPRRGIIEKNILVKISSPGRRWSTWIS